MKGDYMELLQMRYFKTIVAYGSMLAASEELHVSQPTLRAAIKKLESECDVKLFEKKGRNLVCTEAGRSFYEEADKILQSADKLAGKMGTFAK